MRILVVNAGSSSLKLRLLDDSGLIDRADLAPADTAEAAATLMADALLRMGTVDAVGHRVVHGGTAFTDPVVVTPQVTEGLRALTELAPLHQPKSLAALEAAAAALPTVPQVACFDTAFHAGLPAAAATYAVPREWRSRWPIRRYGFHGLSHAYASRRAAELLERPLEELRIVTCHLGAGASLAAVERGRSVDTTMGFTPLEGLVMASRSGDVDPGLLLWLQERHGLTVAAISVALERESGLRGLTGTADMRAVLEAASRDETDAVLGLEVYVHRLRKGIAAMAASLGGLDVLVFTGGVGERSPQIRAAAAESLGFLGVAVDRDRNERDAGDRSISEPGAPVTVLVIEAREDLEIERQVRQVVR